MEPQIGKTYVVLHQRKGRFVATVKGINDPFATLEIADGKAAAMCEYNEAYPGEELTVRLAHCRFIETTTAA